MAGPAGLDFAGLGWVWAGLGYGGPVLARLSWWEISAQKSFSRDLAISMCSTLMLACRAWFTQRKLFFSCHAQVLQHTVTYTLAQCTILPNSGGIRFLRSKEIKKMVMSKRAFQKKNKGIFLKNGFIHDLISVVLYFLSSRLKLEILQNRTLCSSLGELRN